MAFNLSNALLGAGAGASTGTPWGILGGALVGGFGQDIVGQQGQTGYKAQRDPNILAQQQGFVNALQAQTAGQGPNLAGAQLKQALGQAQAGAAGMAAGMKGISPATAARLAMQTQGQMGAQAAGQAGVLALQQQLAAQNTLGQQLYGMQNQALAPQELNANLALKNQQLQNQQVAGMLGAVGDLGAMYATQKQPDGSMTSQIPTVQENYKLPEIGSQYSQPQTGYLGTNTQFGGSKPQNTGPNLLGAQYNEGGEIPSYSQGGEAKSAMAMLKEKYAKKGGKIPGKAEVPGDSPKNDTVPAMLSAGEIVIPRSIAQHQNAPEMAAQFVADIVKKKGVSNFADGGEAGSMEMASTAPEVPYYLAPNAPQTATTKVPTSKLEQLKTILGPKEGGPEGYKAKNPDTGAYGQYQFMDQPWKAVMGNVQREGSTPEQQDTALARLTERNTQDWKRNFKTDPTVGDLALMHQQGTPSVKALMENPDAKAVDLIGKDPVLKNKGTADMTAKQFMDHVRNYYGQAPEKTYQDLPFWQRPETKAGDILGATSPMYGQEQDLSYINRLPEPKPGFLEKLDNLPVPPVVPGMPQTSISQRILHPFSTDEEIQAMQAGKQPISPYEQKINAEYEQFQKLLQQNTAQEAAPQAATPDYFAQAGKAAQDVMSGQIIGASTSAAGQLQAAKQGADLYKQYVDTMAPINKQYEETVQKYQQQRDQLFDNLMTKKIDPTQFYSNKTTGQKIGMAFSMLLGGLASGLGGGPNLAMNTIHKMIDQDLDVQKANIGKDQNLLRLNFLKLGDLNAAYNMTKAQMYTDLESKLTKAAFEAKDPEIRANLMQQIAAIQAQMVPLYRTTAITDTFNKITGAYGSEGGIPGEQWGAVNLLASSNPNDKNLQNLIKLAVPVFKVNPATGKETMRYYKARNEDVYNKSYEMEPLMRTTQHLMKELMDISNNWIANKANPDMVGRVNSLMGNLEGNMAALSSAKIGSKRLQDNVNTFQKMITNPKNILNLLNSKAATQQTYMDMLRGLEDQRTMNFEGYRSPLAGK